MTFLGLGVGQLLAAFSTPIWSRLARMPATATLEANITYFYRLYKRAAIKNGGHAPPEARLVMGMAGAIGKPG